MNAIPEWDKGFKKPSFQDIFKKLEQESAEFNQAKAGLIGPATRFAKDTINDDIVRLSYQRNVERVLAEVTEMIKDGKITSWDGSAWCSYMRNDILDMHREYTSKFGLAIAKAHKKAGKPLEHFDQKYSYELYNKDYNLLFEAETKKVFERIMKKSVEPNKNIHVLLNAYRY